MKKNLIVVGVFLLTVLSFAKINDGLGIISPEDELTIEKKVDEISQKRGVNIYINSFSGEEGYVPETSEKLVVLNLIKSAPDKIKVELKLTKDMELDDVKENIDDILIANENFLKENEIGNYVVGVLTGIDGVLENVKIEEPIVVEEEVVDEKKNSFFIIMGIAFFVIFAIIIRVLMVKYRRSFKEEMDIISRKR